MSCDQLSIVIKKLVSWLTKKLYDISHLSSYYQYILLMQGDQFATKLLTDFEQLFVLSVENKDENSKPEVALWVYYVHILAISHKSWYNIIWFNICRTLSMVMNCCLNFLWYSHNIVLEMHWLSKPRIRCYQMCLDDSIWMNTSLHLDLICLVGTILFSGCKDWLSSSSSFILNVVSSLQGIVWNIGLARCH